MSIYPLQLLQQRGLRRKIPGLLPVDADGGWAHPDCLHERASCTPECVQDKLSGFGSPGTGCQVGDCTPATEHGSAGSVATTAISRRDDPALSGIGWRANARPWPASRTSQQSRQNFRHALTLAIPGYISVYSWVSPAMAAFRLSEVPPMGRPVAGSPTASRYSRCPCA